ncbi:MAG: LPS export ABC transporter periplasmic protein LptC [Prevotella sp.]|nr:LPS export ABC transporter periplasmic protein LptC [Prevotella sp.]
MVFLVACSKKKDNSAPAIRDRDSVAVMTTYGVNTLVSDSGVIKYRIVAEEWEINEVKKPSQWVFNKGILLTQFDLKKHVVGYIQCDTAVYFDKERQWNLRGRVRIKTADGVEFQSSQLYWNEARHEIWSHAYSHLKTPERDLKGNWFRSNEDMTDYEIKKVKGWMMVEDKDMMQGGSSHGLPSEPSMSIDTMQTSNLKSTITKR